LISKIIQLKKQINSSSRQKFLANTGWIVGERVYQMLISLVVGVMTARYLGPSNYGIINYAASFIAFFSSICTLGLEGIIVKELVDNPEREGELLGSGIIMRLASSLISMIAILILISVLNRNDIVMLVVATLQSIALLFRSVELIEFWYQSKLQSKYSSIIKGIGYTTMSLYKVVLLITGKSVEWFAFSTTVDSIIIALLFLYFYHRQGGNRLRFRFTTVKELISQSYHFILSGIIVVIYNHMDKVMIGQYLSEKQVGLYSAAITICNMWVFVPNALINSARPLIMKLKGQNEDLYVRRLKQLYSFIWWMGIAFALIISAFSTLIVLILYGRQYLDAVPSLIIASWYTVFSVLGTARGIWILCEGKYKFVKRYLSWGVVVNLVLNTILIPMWGIEGAAFATLVTQIVTAIIAPVFYKETRIHSKYVLEALFFKGVLW
jgi:O-antigen/teichoic acid export membrane protein